MIVVITILFFTALTILQLCIVIQSDSEKRLNADHTETVVAILREKSIKGTFLRLSFLLQVLAALFLTFNYVWLVFDKT